MRITQEQFQLYAVSPAAFRADLLIDGGNGVVRFGDVIEPYQQQDFEQLDAGWLHCTGRPQSNVKQRAYLERPRGHSKTSDAAISVVWALTFAPKVLRGFAAAADKDQARILRDAIVRLASLNPFLGEVLEIQNYVVKNAAAGHPGRGSQLEIMTSDVGSSYGLLPDFILCDEITHWGSSGEEMFGSLISSAAKRPSCMFTIMTNAGNQKGSSWQWKLRENACSAPGWYFSSLDGPKASWITPETLDEQRRFLPGPAFQRLWLNQWASGGDAIDGSDVEASVTVDAPHFHADREFSYVAGLDLGVKRDHSALVVLGTNMETRRIRLAQSFSWKPPGNGESVDLSEVAAAVLDVSRRFKAVVYFDPHQAALMSQQLSRSGVTMREFSLAGQSQVLMASTMLECFRSRRVDLYRDPELLRGISSLNIEARSYGYRLVAGRSTETGHCDKAIAFAMALTKAVELASRPRINLSEWIDVM